MVDTLVALGILASVALMAVSATLNFRMGVRSADGIDGWVYGIGAACGDVLKAMAPFMGHYGLKHKDRVAAGVALAVFLVLTAYSFTAAYGFSAFHRADRTASADKRIEDHGTAAAAYRRIAERLDKLGPQRTPGEVQAAIDTLYARPVGKVTLEKASEHCNVLRQWTRGPCGEVAALEEELQRAKAYQQAESQEQKLRLDMKGEGATPTTDDAQLAGIRSLLAVVHVTVSKDVIGYGLALLLALLIELGSGLGLYLVTTPLRANVKVKGGERMHTPDGQNSLPVEQQRGEVVEYVTNNVFMSEEGELGLDELFTDYLSWCRKLNRYPVARASFEKAMARFAQLAGLEATAAGGDIWISGIAIVGE